MQFPENIPQCIGIEIHWFTTYTEWITKLERQSSPMQFKWCINGILHPQEPKIEKKKRNSFSLLALIITCKTEMFVSLKPF